jgi:prophage regulatory protein
MIRKTDARAVPSDTHYAAASAAKLGSIYLSVKAVSDRYDASANTIWRWAKTRPEFPKPIKFGPGCTRWRLSDLVEFERALEVAQ